MVDQSKLIYTTAPAASKYDARFKSGQNHDKNNHLALLIQIRDTLYVLSLVSLHEYLFI